MAVETRWSVKDECLKNKYLYLKVCGLSLLLAIIYSVSLPKVYEARMKLIIESNVLSVDIGGNNSSKINYDKSFLGKDPNVYMDIVEAPGFLDMIGHVRVEPIDDSYHTDFADYIQNHSREPWWNILLGGTELNERIRNSVKCEINKATDLLTIQVSAQDSYVAAILADSIKNYLQQAVTKSKTMKAKSDLIYQTKLRRNAGTIYHQKMLAYSQYCDSHFGESDSKTESEKDYLEQEKNSAFENYEKISSLCEKTIMRIQNNSSVLVFVDKPHVPLYPSSPNVLANLFVFFFYSFVLTTFWILYKRKYKEILKYEK